MVKKDCSILVVDTDQAGARSLVNELKRLGYQVLTARDSAHAALILEFRAFEVLIIDEDSSLVEEMDLVGWASCLCPKPRIVVTGKPGKPGTEEKMLGRGANIFLAKPPDIGKLEEFLARTRTRSSFCGKVEEVDIIEYVQFVILGGQKTVLEITSSLGTQGRLFMADGNVLHAVCGVLEGEAALYRCLCFREGTFAHLPWEEPAAKTINRPGEFLLMEAVRKRDEAWSDDSEQGSRN